MMEVLSRARFLHLWICLHLYYIPHFNYYKLVSSHKAAKGQGYTNVPETYLITVTHTSTTFSGGPSNMYLVKIT